MSFGFGKIRMLNKLSSQSESIKQALNDMLSIRTTPLAVTNAGLFIFQFLYGDERLMLNQLRYRLYLRMAAIGKINPANLPPTTSAAAQHSLRPYLQYHNWALLNT